MEKHINEYAVSVSDLTIKYGNFTAVDNISFNVNKGEIFGIIGPNGAGKTSTLECLEGLRPYNSGNIKIFGEDYNREKIYTKMGVQLQETKFQDNIKVKELMSLYSSLYETPADTNELLVFFDLIDKNNEFVKKLSGGQKQKLAIIIALIGNPEILVLDEISTGLDPQARVQIWNKIKELNKKGKTILLTTHFMEEAEHLCDRVCLLVKGKIKIEGTLQEIVKQANLNIKINAYATKEELKKLKLSDIPNGIMIKVNNDYVELTLSDYSQISQAMTWVCERIKIIDIDLYKPKLEDVFLHLTGTKLEVNE